MKLIPSPNPHHHSEPTSGWGISFFPFLCVYFRTSLPVRTKIQGSESHCAELLKAVDLMQKQNLQRKLEFQEAISTTQLDLELVQEVVDLNLILQQRLRSTVDKHTRYVNEGRKVLNKQLGIRCAEDDMLFVRF